jgi:hypothetical protein
MVWGFRRRKLTEDAAHDFANEVARETRDELRKLAVKIK